LLKQFKFKNDYLSQFRTNFDDHLFILVCYYLQRYVTENVAAYRNVLFCQNLLLISWRILWIQKHETWSPWWIESTDNCQILQGSRIQIGKTIFMMNLSNMNRSRKQKGIQNFLRRSLWVSSIHMWQHRSLTIISHHCQEMLTHPSPSVKAFDPKSWKARDWLIWCYQSPTLCCYGDIIG
jgi:hypothetical protein